MTESTILADIDLNYLKNYVNDAKDDYIPISLNNKSITISKLKKVIETNINICACLIKSVCECGTSTCDCEDDIYYSILNCEVEMSKIKLCFKENIDLLKKNYYIKIFTYDMMDNEIHIMHIDHENKIIKVMLDNPKIFSKLNIDSILCNQNKLIVNLK